MTLDCVIPTQSSVMQTAMLVWSVFFSILLKCLFVIIVMYAYFIHINSQGNVEMHLRSGGIYNNHIIANCLQSVPINEFWKLVAIIGEDMNKSKVVHFLVHPVHMLDIVNYCTGKLFHTVHSSVHCLSYHRVLKILVAYIYYPRLQVDMTVICMYRNNWTNFLDRKKTMMTLIVTCCRLTPYLQ